jgi:RNA-binding protein
MSVPRPQRKVGGGRSGKGDVREGGPDVGERTPKKKAGGARRTRVKQRFDKKSGDVRSKPGTRADGSSKKAKAGPITGSGMRYLRGLGHHLDPVVQIGKDGITDALVAAASEALRAHELIKVKVGTEAPVDRREAGPLLAARTDAVLAQVLGRTLLLYKRHPSKPRIEIPG